MGMIIFEVVQNTLELLNSAVRNGFAGVYPQNMPFNDTK